MLCLIDRRSMRKRMTRLASPTIIVLMLLTTWSVHLQPAAAQGAPFLSITAPTQVEVGEPITFTLTSRGIPSVGGYEAAMLFNTQVAEFHAMEQHDNDLARQFGRGVEPLAAVEVPYGAAFGIVSCPYRNCVNPGGTRQSEGGQGNVELARITILPYEEGVLEVRFDAIKVVHAKGFTLPANIPAKTFEIQVGAGGPRHAAPALPWSLSTRTSGASRSVDVTESGHVSYQDLVEVAMEWQALREHGQPCGQLRNPALDINSDGCIDVSDIQLVAAQLALASATSSPQGRLEGEAASATHTLQQASNVYIVNSVSDQGGANVGNGICATQSGECTLRSALQEAVRSSVPTTINFDIPGSGVRTIVLSGPLPTLWGSANPITIDGYTQPGSSPNTDPHVSNAKIMVQIEGGGHEAFEAIRISSSGNVVRGLAFYKFTRVFWLYGGLANNNVFHGNFVGTNAVGTHATTQTASSQAHGFHLEKGAAGNRIGGTALAERNVISGNGRHGVGMWHPGTTSNMVYNNLVGLSPSGNSCLRNHIEGADMNYGASNNIIGGLEPGQRNVFTGMGLAGVDISHGLNTTGNQVIGNFIGTNATGTGLVSNCTNNRLGIRVKDGVRNNVISHNVIGGSRDAGIRIESPPIPLNDYITTNNVFTDNWIGVTPEGNAIPNPVGMLINGQYNRVGPNNVIARNNGAGVYFDYVDSDFNTVTRNSFYNNTGKGIRLATGANEDLAGPVLQSATTSAVGGTACANCIVEVFIATGNAGQQGQGRTFVGSGQANASGAVNVFVSGVPSNANVTATATDASGNTSEFALNIAVAGTGSLPAAPSDLAATVVSSSQIDLSWTDNADNENEFVIERSFDQTTWQVIASAPMNSESHSDTTVRVNTTYYYRVKAVNSDGASGVTNIASGSTATSLPGRIQAEDYRDGGAGFGYHDTTAGNSGGAYRSDDVDIQVTSDTGGGFNVGWIDAGEWLAYEVIVEVTGAFTFDARVATVNTGRSFHIEIDGVDVTGPISVPNTGGWQAWTTVSSGSVTIETGAHTVRFVAETNGFNFNYFDVAAEIVSPTTPATPSDLAATAVTSTQIDLTWMNNSTNEDNIVVERSTDEATWEVIDTLAAGASSYSDTAVSGGTTYYYRISATNAVGSSDPSNTALATTPAGPAAPAAPSDLAAAVPSSTQIDLTWTDNAGSEDNMVVERSFDGSTWQVVETLPANSESYSDTAVRINSTYYYRVIATSTAGNSEPSGATSASTATSLPGRIQAEDYRDGGAGFGYHDTTAGNSGGAYRSDDVDIQVTSDTGGGFNVGWIDAGEWLAFEVLAESTAEHTFAVRLASPNSDRRFHIEIDSVDVTGPVTVPNTGGWQAWTTVSVGPVTIQAGAHTITYVAEVNGFNFNYIDMTVAQPPPWETVFALPGRIEVENYRAGGPGIGYHDTTAGNSGGAYRGDDVDIQMTSDTGGGFNVGWIDAGEWLAFNVAIETAGNFIFEVRVASPNSGRRLHIQLDGVDVTGPIALPNTGGWQTWGTVSSGPVSIAAGTYTVRIVAETNGFNLNYLEAKPAP